MNNELTRIPIILPSTEQYEHDIQEALDESNPHRNGIPRHLYERYKELIEEYNPEITPSLYRICYPN